jgi:hypothetical protein
LGELGLLYGRVRSTRFGHVSISTGVSVVGLSECGGRSRRSCTTAGIPLVAEAAAGARYVGLGLQAYGNLNPRAPYAGLAFFIQLGWMP